VYIFADIRYSKWQYYRIIVTRLVFITNGRPNKIEKRKIREEDSKSTGEILVTKTSHEGVELKRQNTPMTADWFGTNVREFNDWCNRHELNQDARQLF